MLSTSFLTWLHAIKSVLSLAKILLGEKWRQSYFVLNFLKNFPRLGFHSSAIDNDACIFKFSCAITADVITFESFESSKSKHFKNFSVIFPRLVRLTSLVSYGEVEYDV